MSRPELVSCSLCGAIWAVPRGTGSSAHTRHYREEHSSLEAERVTR